MTPAKKLSPLRSRHDHRACRGGEAGGAAWWYLSGQLQDAQAEVTAAAGKFDTYSKQEVYLPTHGNVKTLQNDIAVMTAQLDPIVQAKLQSPGNKLSSIDRIDTVTWKRNLDDEVRQLNSAAKLHGLVVPKNFYYGFSRYLNQKSMEEATPVPELPAAGHQGNRRHSHQCSRPRDHERQAHL